MMMYVGYRLAIPRVDKWPPFLYKQKGSNPFIVIETI